MMVFFFIGYIGVTVISATGLVISDFLLVSVIFFFGSIFVLCMVSGQKKMSGTIVRQTVETIHTMIGSIEAKDIYTKGHSEHVLRLVELIYQHLPDHIKNDINPVILRDAAMLHDIGKVGIPDVILNKPGKLTEDEWEIVRQHPRNGKILLEQTSFRDICDVVICHHERVDGKGYYGVPGDNIPIESRIIAIADTFSALNTDRVYRQRYSYHEAIAILKESAGTQLDAELVDVFCQISEQDIEKASISMPENVKHCESKFHKQTPVRLSPEA